MELGLMTDKISLLSVCLSYCLIISEALMSAKFRCQQLFWYQHSPGVSKILASTYFWCQRTRRVIDFSTTNTTRLIYMQQTRRVRNSDFSSTMYTD
jgi:hypothetical protein